MAHADHAQRHERLVDVGAFLVPRPQASHLVEQRQRLLDHVAEHAQSAAVRRVPPRDLGGDGPRRQLQPVRVGVVPTVAGDLPGLSQRRADLPADRRDRVDQRDQLRHVVGVGPGQDRRERDAAGVDRQVVLAARLAAVRGVRPGLGPPKTARTEAESTTTRLKSISSAHAACPAATRAASATPSATGC